MSSRPVLELLPDAERLVVNFLRASTRVQAIVADRVYAAFPAQAGPGPLLLVQRIGGDPPFSQPLIADAAILQLSAYGGPRATASDLARTAAAVLTELEGTVQPEGAVSAVSFAALRPLDDDTYDPPRPRYLLEATVTVVTAKPTAAIALAAQT